jgi:hypothetical protein
LSKSRWGAEQLGRRPNIGQTAGTFTKLGLRLEVLYTNGGGPTVQAVIAGGANNRICRGIAGECSGRRQARGYPIGWHDSSREVPRRREFGRIDMDEQVRRFLFLK